MFQKKYIGIDTVDLVHGKVYEVLNEERGWYRIITELEEDYLFPPEFFVNEDEDGNIDDTPYDYIMKHLVEVKEDDGENEVVHFYFNESIN